MTITMPPFSGRRKEHAVVSVAVLSIATVLLGWAQQSETERLSFGDVLKLIEAGVTDTRVVTLVEQRGTSFVLDKSSEELLRNAGAQEILILALKKPGLLVVHTRPGLARIFLDEQEVGTTSDSGSFQLPGIRPGAHTVRAEVPNHRPAAEAFWLSPGRTHLAELPLEVGSPANPEANQEGVSKPAPLLPSTPPPSAKTLYDKALRAFTGEEYESASQFFTQYIKYYEGSQLAGNAQFYLGEISFRQKDYRRAINEYDKVLDNYPTSFKVPAAHLKKGYALLELNERDAGIQVLKALTEQFPKSEEARLARERLRRFGEKSVP